jgi:hypothetical protein
MLAAGPSVFVSHGAKGEFALGVLNALGDAMRDAGFDPFIDFERLQPGDRWRRELRTRALHCQAGVLLLCTDALNSEWVLQEGSIMLARWEDGGGFVLMPVLLGDVSEDDIRVSPLGHLGLPDDVQMANASTVDEAINKILAGLASTLEKFAHRRPLFELENDVAARLRQIPVGEAALRRMAAVVGVDPTRWHPEGLVEAVARRIFEDDVTLDDLTDALRPMGGGGPAGLGLVDTVIPFKTIPKEAAATLGPMVAVRKPGSPFVQPRPAALARAARDRTGDWYLRRAAARISKPAPVKILANPQPEVLDADLSDHVAAEVRAVLGFFPDDEPPDDELERAFDDHEQHFGPVTVILARECDDQLVRRLRSDHRRVVFLVLTRNAEPEQLGLDAVTILYPLIDAEQERIFHRRYFEMTRMR